MGGTLDIVGLARVLAARNGAKSAMVARICADVKIGWGYRSDKRVVQR